MRSHARPAPGRVTWASTVRRLLRRLGLVVVLVFSVLLFGDPEVFADVPTPAPSPSSGSVAGAWTCTDRYVTPSPNPPDTPSPEPTKVGQDCAVSEWVPIPPESRSPLPDPLPVHEVSPPPASVSSVSSLSCSPEASPSTPPSPSASPTPSPSPSAGDPVSTGCAVSLDAAQWNPMVWFAGALLLIAVAGFVLKYSRRIGSLVR